MALSLTIYIHRYDEIQMSNPGVTLKHKYFSFCSVSLSVHTLGWKRLSMPIKGWVCCSCPNDTHSTWNKGTASFGVSLFYPLKQSFKAPLLQRHPDLSQIENVRKINPGHREAQAIDFYISNVSRLAAFLCWSACLSGPAVVPACCQPVFSCKNSRLLSIFFPSFTPNSKDPCRCCG